MVRGRKEQIGTVIGRMKTSSKGRSNSGDDDNESNIHSSDINWEGSLGLAHVIGV